jgi:small subunit ribosomal protein S17
MATEGPGQAVVSPPKGARGQRPTRIGIVTSDAREKSIRVTVSYSVTHPKYGKTMRRRTVLHAHDETNDAKRGDRVEIVECRPISKTKHWRLVRVLERAPQQQASGSGK